MNVSRRQVMIGGAAAAAGLALTTTACSSGGGDQNAEAGGGAPASRGDQERSLPVTFTPILVSTVGAETAPVACSDGKWRAVYELLLTNSKPAPATIERIDVVDLDDPDRVVVSVDGPDLVESLRHLSGAPASTADLPVDETRVLLVELVFDSVDDVPDAVAQRFVGLAAANPGTDVASPVDYLTAPFTLTDRTALRVAAPLAGGGWMAVNGLGTAGGAHRGSIQSIDGTLFDAQRFAIDWMLLDDEDTLSSGDPSKVESFHCFGASVMAVADGTVVGVVDELPDQPPGTLPDPASITIETVDGNHVILEIGDGVYAFYAHLSAGSIAVAVGDVVAAGDELGKLGNSGNTSAPHLHLHFMTDPNALAADSIPYVFDTFTLDGMVDEEAWLSTDDIAGPWDVIPTDGAKDRTDQLPLGLTVVTFGVE